MMKNTLEDYKKAIKAKYEIEKTGVYSSSLLHPSRAKLRSFCFELFKDNPSSDDLKIFASFVKFEFDASCTNKLKKQTDRFRPIENFFKGETEPTDIETINMAAILVDFELRPYLKFSKSNFVETTKYENEEPIPEQIATVFENNSISLPTQNLINTKNQKPLNKKIAQGLIFLSVLGIGYSAKVIVFPEKECMEWQKDHYQIVGCSGLGTNSKIPLDESLLELRRIWACDTTTYFRNNKAIIWYYKSGEDNLELFNKPGFHPVYQKPLRPITEYMIDKYLK